MLRIILSIVILLIAINSIAQTTAIPDANFEQALIDYGYDSGPIDGIVLTSNISLITSINLNSKGITSLTGIEDFNTLNKLFCDFNQLTTLDVSQNTTLTELHCAHNQLPTLDVSQNIALFILDCKSNLLSL